MENISLKNIKVLLVDDDEDDYVIIRRTFEKIKNSPFLLEWTSSFDKAKELISAKQHDLYLIDYRLGEHSGLELLEFAKPERRIEPFILLTGDGDDELQRRSIELSASEYLVKGAFGSELLSRTMQYAIGRKHAEQQRLDHLVDLNRNKDEFISIASHQLRTPATGVKQYLGMILEGFVGEVATNQREIILKAYQSNERQLRIVSDLLKVAQVDAGKVMLHKLDTSIDDLMADIVTEQRDTFAGRKQKVVFEPVKGGHIAIIDQDAVRMVLENITDNASKYSRNGTTIEIDLSENETHVKISIADEGVGIPLEDQGRLFEKFTRIENPLSTKVGGTGLGLYWAKKIIDLHNGMIKYSNNETGKGSVFTIYLPKHKL